MEHKLASIEAELHTIASLLSISRRRNGEDVADYANRIIQAPSFPQSYLRDVLDLKARAQADSAQLHLDELGELS